MPPRRGGVSPRPKIVIDWSVWYRDCDGVGTYQRAPPHLPKWPRRLTRAFSSQLHLTRVMFSAASFQGSSPLGTTCVHAPMYMSFSRRTIVTSCPAFYTLTFIDCILIRLIKLPCVMVPSMI